MAELIIGHTTQDSTTIWVRGGRGEQWVELELAKPGEDPVQRVERTLSSATDFTWSHRFQGLDANTAYEVVAQFASSQQGLKHPRKVKGRLRTFPNCDSNEPFSFLHGSCNLSTVRITDTGGLALGALGWTAGLMALERLAGTRDERGSRWLERAPRLLASCILACLAKLLFKWIYSITRFEQPIDPKTPFLPSPFTELRELVTQPENPARFMIHAGDQIYYDIPLPNRRPEIAEYRRTYRQTWFEDQELRGLLTECPHYMIWDDHDIVDAFARDGRVPGDRQPCEYFFPARDAYQEYVHSRQPGGDGGNAFFYQFRYGKTPFFVLDTRGERYIHRGEMISESQMKALKSWLGEHPKQQLKFVVSSVAFLAELRHLEDRDDKWCGEAFREQRDEILAHVFDKEIKRVVFLVGDMHCTYHASMTLGRFRKRVTLHELAGGPAYQLQFASPEDFYDQYAGEIRAGGEREPLPYTTSLRRIHCASSSVLKVTASPTDASSAVRWEIVSTARQLDPVESGKDGKKHAAGAPLGSKERSESPVAGSIRPPRLSGRISFF